MDKLPAVHRHNAALLREATPAELKGEARFIEQLKSEWERLPMDGRLKSHLPTTVDNMQRAIAPLFNPAGPKAVAVLLDRLFSVLPMPGEDALAVWSEFLEPCPADILKRAVDAVIRTHKWNTPPTIAQVIEAAEKDALAMSREELRLKATELALRMRHDIERDRRHEEENKRWREERDRFLEESRRAIERQHRPTYIDLDRGGPR